MILYEHKNKMRGHERDIISLRVRYHITFKKWVNTNESSYVIVEIGYPTLLVSLGFGYPTVSFRFGRTKSFSEQPPHDQISSLLMDA
jgi:hypothetical protein